MVKTIIDDGTQTTVLQTVGTTTTAIITDTENPFLETRLAISDSVPLGMAYGPMMPLNGMPTATRNLIKLIAPTGSNPSES